MSFDEAMADLRKTAAAIDRPKTLAAQNAERIEMVETELEYLRRERLQMWQAILLLLPAPQPQ